MKMVVNYTHILPQTAPYLYGDIAYNFAFIDDTFYILSTILDLGRMFILPRGDEIIANTSTKNLYFSTIN